MTVDIENDSGNLVIEINKNVRKQYIRVFKILAILFVLFYLGYAIFWGLNNSVDLAGVFVGVLFFIIVMVALAIASYSYSNKKLAIIKSSDGDFIVTVPRRRFLQQDKFNVKSTLVNINAVHPELLDSSAKNKYYMISLAFENKVIDLSSQINFPKVRGARSLIYFLEKNDVEKVANALNVPVDYKK